MKEQCLFLEPDLSQAEDRVVKVLSGHEEAIELARRHPAEFDAHTNFAARLYSVIRGHSVSPAEVTKAQRRTGKRGKHAKNYGMQPPKLQEVFLKEDGVFVELAECVSILRAVDVVEPWIDMYQKETTRLIRTYKRLVNSWGREIDFTDDRQDDALLRRGYAFRPQSEVGDLENQWGWLALFKHLKANKMRSHINAQNHDALLVSVVRDEVYEIAKFLDWSLSRPRMYGQMAGESHGIELSIPVTLCLGPTWYKAGMREWKRLPSKEEMLEEFDRQMTQRTASGIYTPPKGICIDV